MPTPTSTLHWGKVLDRLIDTLFNDHLRAQKPMYPMLFNVKKIDKYQEKQMTAVGLEDWRQSGEAIPATYTGPLQGYVKNYVPKVWKSGFQVTRELRDDDQYGVVEDYAKQLARTAIRTIDKQAAKVLVNAFNTTFTTGADGLALASASHTREDGGTANLDNADTGVLNETNLENAIVAFQEMRDGRGELVDMEPDVLVVPPALEKEALILMKSTGRVSTADNDINVYNGRLRVVVWPRLGSIAGGSDTAWFIMDSSYNKSGAGMNVVMRVNPEVKPTEEAETHVRKYIGYMRFDVGFTDWRGVYASTGTV